MTAPSLVTLSNKKNKQSIGTPTFMRRLALGPIADKCFVLAGLGSLFGIGYLGLILWLVRNSQIAPPKNFMDLRTLHIYQQFIFFFGLSILGFSLQSLPRFLSLAGPIPPLFRLLPVATLFCAWLSLLISGLSITTRILSCMPFALTTYFLCAHLISQRRLNPPLLFLLVSLLTFTFAALSSLEEASHTLIFLWFGLGGPLLGFSQLFIGNLLGGRQLSKKEHIASLSLFVLAGKTGEIGVLYQSSFALAMMGALSFAHLSFFILRTKLLSLSSGESRHPALQFAFRTSYLWALIGALVVLIEPSDSDAALHLWASGWGTTILIAMTAHIISFLAGTTLSKRFPLSILIIWQLVPLGRGLGPILELPQWMSLLVVPAALYGLFGWIYILLKAEMRILVRQRHATEREPMVQEG